MTPVIRRISRILQNHRNLLNVYAAVAIIAVIFCLITFPQMTLNENQLYPKTIDQSSPLNPYDRGGAVFEKADILSQYPENLENTGYITAYLSPLAILITQYSCNFGTTIAAHPGGILDEILYNTRGLDTIVETTILFIAFAAAMFLYRRREEE